MYCKHFLIFVSMFFVATIIPSTAAKIQINYEYNSVGICQAATATLDDGSLIGKARLENLVKGDYYLVREIHYSPRTGSVIYEGLSKFAITNKFYPLCYRGGTFSRKKILIIMIR